MSLDQLTQLWRDQGMAEDQLELVELPTAPRILPSSFQVGMAAQASIAAAALASNSIYSLRCGQQQRVSISQTAAEVECTGLFKLDGETPNPWEKFSGLYPTQDGHVRVHANFAHHRDGVLSILGLGDAAKVEKEDVSQALLEWQAEEFETAAAERNLVVAKVRSFDEWDEHPHALAASSDSLIKISKIGEADPANLATINRAERPLTGLKVLDLTRILAGPVCGRTLAAYGADVMLVNGPHLPNISAIIETSRGKRSTQLDLRRADHASILRNLVGDTDIFVQGYRPGGINELGFSGAELADLRPGIICVSLSAYGNKGPWAGKRGFDSLVQTATGFNHAEAQAFESNTPKPMPVQILDYASGFLMAYGAQAAMLKQAELGGSWHVEVSLLQTANWLRSLGRSYDQLDVRPKKLSSYLHPYPCLEGELLAMPHAASFEQTPATWLRPASMPGSDQPVW